MGLIPVKVHVSAHINFSNIGSLNNNNNEDSVHLKKVTPFLSLTAYTF